MRLLELLTALDRARETCGNNPEVFFVDCNGLNSNTINGVELQKTENSIQLNLMSVPSLPNTIVLYPPTFKP